VQLFVRNFNILVLVVIAREEAVALPYILHPHNQQVILVSHNQLFSQAGEAVVLAETVMKTHLALEAIHQVNVSPLRKVFVLGTLELVDISLLLVVQAVPLPIVVNLMVAVVPVQIQTMGRHLPQCSIFPLPQDK